MQGELTELRQGLEPYVARPLRSALRSWIQDLIALVALVAIGVMTDHDIGQLTVGVGVGLVGTNLFMIAHDAAHGSFTHLPRLNAAIARLNFLVAFHPVDAWRHVHHDVHHRSTNDLDIDVVWTPLTPAHYASLGPLAKLYHRCCRTTPGFGLYYLTRMWGGELMGFAPRQTQPRGLWRGRLGVAAAAVCAGLLGWVSGGAVGVVSLTVVPLFIVAWAIGFVVYFNHTHPLIPWSHGGDDVAQFEGTVRLTYPPLMAFFLGNIMDHAAHHVHPGIPLANLSKAQDHLDSLLGPRGVRQRWTPAEHRRILRTCRLFDPIANQWCDWDASPTTPPLGASHPIVDLRESPASSATG